MKAVTIILLAIVSLLPLSAEPVGQKAVFSTVGYGYRGTSVEFGFRESEMASLASSELPLHIVEDEGSFTAEGSVQAYWNLFSYDDVPFSLSIKIGGPLMSENEEGRIDWTVSWWSGNDIVSLGSRAGEARVYELASYDAEEDSKGQNFSGLANLNISASFSPDEIELEKYSGTLALVLEAK